MKNEQQIEIPLSKSKMKISLFGSLTFVGLGLVFIFFSAKISTPFFSSLMVIKVLGIISVLFFGIIAGILVRKLSDGKPGLIINNQGITDNSSGVSAGLVLWTDVEEIKVSQVMSQKFLMVIVKNPEYYLDKVSNPLKRNMMKLNFKSYGSPISISANALQIDFDDLERLLEEKMMTYKFI